MGNASCAVTVCGIIPSHGRGGTTVAGLMLNEPSCQLVPEGERRPKTGVGMSGGKRSRRMLGECWKCT